MLVKLKNGKSGILPIVKVTMAALSNLIEDQPIVFYELVMKCRDEDHKFFGETGKVLENLKMCDAGIVPEAIRDVVLSAVSGEGHSMALGSPYDDEEVTEKQPDRPPAEMLSMEEQFEADYKLYVVMRRIADLIFSYADAKPFGRNQGVPRLEDRRKEKVNPYYDQTDSGLFLELYYGQPSSIHTPWGKWGFGGSGSGDWEKILEEILPLLGAVIHKPLQVNNMGEFGPVYAITSFEGESLPPAYQRERRKFATYEYAKKRWELLEVRYKMENDNISRSVSN